MTSKGVSEMNEATLLDSIQVTNDNGSDEDLFALISSLIDQNAELMQKVHELNSQKELANIVLTEVVKQEETIRLLVEIVSLDRASVIVEDAKTNARIEGDRILAEAKRKAEEIVEGKTQLAIQQGLLIINKAEEKALSTLEEVRKQAEAISGKANRKVKQR